jgi:hypothetical protein
MRELLRYYSSEAGSVLVLRDDGTILLLNGKVWQHKPESIPFSNWLETQRDIYNLLPKWKRDCQTKEPDKATPREPTSALIKLMEDIELRRGVSWVGDFERVRQMVYSYNARTPKHFLVRMSKEEGRVLIIRDK